MPGVSSSYHLLEVVHSAAELLEHESRESCFCTWENCEYQGYLPGLLSRLTCHISFRHGQPCLPAGGRSAPIPPPRLRCELSRPPSQQIPGEPPVQHADLATNKWFSLLVEFKENGFQNLKKKTTNLYIYKKIMSEACWTLRSKHLLPRGMSFFLSAHPTHTFGLRWPSNWYASEMFI